MIGMTEISSLLSFFTFYYPAGKFMFLSFSLETSSLPEFSTSFSSFVALPFFNLFT